MIETLPQSNGRTVEFDQYLNIQQLVHIVQLIH